MVLREGAELALILRAVELSSEGLAVWLGTGLGLSRGDRRGPVFLPGHAQDSAGPIFQGDQRHPGGRGVQLALTGVHELSEAMWIPSSKREMALVGPIVRNDVFFFAVILGAAALIMLREWLALPTGSAGARGPE
jgi:high-affinity iron transporter